MALGTVNVGPAKQKAGGLPIVTATGDGATYTATVDGVTALEKGYSITIIPDTTSTTTLPKLNLNSLGAKNIKQRLSQSTSLTTQAQEAGWLVANKPVTLTYDGLQWVTMFARSSVNDMYGVLAIEKGGTGASSLEELQENLGLTGGGSASYLATIGTAWTENEETGVKSQTVNISGITADSTAKVDVAYTGDETSESYESYVAAQNEFLDYITNGYAETVDGGITFYIFGDANTVEIPIVVEVG